MSSKGYSYEHHSDVPRDNLRPETSVTEVSLEPDEGTPSPPRVEAVLRLATPPGESGGTGSAKEQEARAPAAVLTPREALQPSHLGSLLSPRSIDTASGEEDAQEGTAWKAITDLSNLEHDTFGCWIVCRGHRQWIAIRPHTDELVGASSSTGTDLPTASSPAKKAPKTKHLRTLSEVRK